MNNKFTGLISIIIPTYNHANFLGKALESILNQSYKNWEAIVIDNHSKDGTTTVLNKYKDSRIRYLKINNNGILAKSRNLGIQKAEGEWIAFLDSDDWWKKEKLETCTNEINKNIDLIYHDLEVVYKSKTFFRIKSFKGRELKEPILNDLLINTIEYGNPIGQSSVIVRKTILKKIGGINEDKDLVGSEDYNTWLRVSKISNQFKYIRKCLGSILIHDKNVSNKDMSIPQRKAVADFLELLNNKQKIDLEVKLKYMSASYNYLNNNKKQAKIDFIYVIKNGLLHLKIRSLIKIFLMIFK